MGGIVYNIANQLGKLPEKFPHPIAGKDFKLDGNRHC
jgi:hypothetical protein